MDDRQPIAHAANDAAGVWRDPHGLAEHLRAVASLASQHARLFNGSDWAHLAGLWHDLGKYRPRFQHYIRHASGFDADAHIKGEGGKAPHCTAGAILACNRFDIKGCVRAYLIAGRHAGLYDWNSENASLKYRLQQQGSRDEFNEAMGEYPPPDILDHGAFVPDLRTMVGGRHGFALWVRCRPTFVPSVD